MAWVRFAATQIKTSGEGAQGGLQAIPPWREATQGRAHQEGGHESTSPVPLS